MIKKELMDKLKVFNLNSYESKIWLALLMKGSDTAGSLSDLAEVPRSRCYDVLESLEKKGFIMMKIGKPIKYIAVSPSEVVERLKQKLKLELQDQVKQIENVKQSDLMTSLNELFNSGKNEAKPEEMTALIKNNKNIENHLNYMMRNTDSIFLSVDSKSLKKTLPIIKEIMKTAGKTVKIITDKETDASLLNEISKLAEVKQIENTKRFCVTDENAALFLTDDTENSMIWLNSTYSVETLKDLFDAKWAMA